MSFYAESDILRHVLAIPSFRAFYDEYRQRIAFPLRWVIDPEMGDGAIGVNHVIHLPGIPQNEYTAYITAHELMHEVLYSEHFPGIELNGEGRYMALASCLGSVVQDGLVDSRLRAYFDIACLSMPRLNAAAEIERQQSSADTYTGLARAWSVIAYVYRALRWIAGTGADVSANPALQVYRAKNPSIVREAEKILSRIQAVGYATPEQHRQHLRDLIVRYGLAQFGMAIKEY